MKWKTSRSYCFRLCFSVGASSSHQPAVFLTLFRKVSAHDFNRHFHDDHQINAVLLYCIAFYGNEETFTAPKKKIREGAERGKSLNPLSSEFDTIITKDFRCCQRVVSPDYAV